MAVRSVLLRLLVATLLISNVIGADTESIASVDATEETTTVSTNSVSTESNSATTYIANFATSAEVAKWVERSDTMKSGGMSKWDGVWYNTTSTKGSMNFFALYPPTVSGRTAYAGCRKVDLWNLSSKTSITLKFKQQGTLFPLRVILRHKKLNEDPNPTFNMVIQVKNTTAWQTAKLPLKSFVPMVEEVVNKTITLDTSQISAMNVQTYGGGVGTCSVLISTITAQ